MCGIAGLIHRGKTSDIGAEMTSMLQSLKHRGPDSTGFALYGRSQSAHYVMRFKVAEQEDMRKSLDIHDKVKERRAIVDQRLDKLGVKMLEQSNATEYAHRYQFAYNGDMRALAEQVEDVDSAEILSIGPALELVKDVADASTVAARYAPPDIPGTHAAGHTRPAPACQLRIRSSPPYCGTACRAVGRPRAADFLQRHGGGKLHLSVVV